MVTAKSKNKVYGDRKLQIFEIIARHGPVSNNQMAQLAKLPRVTVWRAVTALRKAGWVRIRRRDNSAELSAAIEDMFNRAQFAHAESLEYDQILDEVDEITLSNVSVGLLLRPGGLTLVDGTSDGIEVHDDAGPFDLSFLGALTQCNNEERARHITKVTTGLRNAAELNDFLLAYKVVASQVSQYGYAVDLEQGIACVPTNFRTGMSGAFILEAKSVTRRLSTFLEDDARRLTDLVRTRIHPIGVQNKVNLAS